MCVSKKFPSSAKTIKPGTTFGIQLQLTKQIIGHSTLVCPSSFFRWTIKPQKHFETQGNMPLLLSYGKRKSNL